MLDRDACYRAVVRRDPRFDGRFFTGVESTGIYCRPVCPARTPLLRHVRFFPCAAAAEEAGFRPCRRCRPETAPGTPAWSGTSGTVSRALALIAEGALDGGSVGTLAARLGIGERHLRRLFLAHVGASPAAVARTRRVHFARRVLEETDLPLAEVAIASGFSSVRRFHAAMRQTFGRAPRDLRRRPRERGSGETVSIELRLPYRPPFSWDMLIGFLAARAIPGVEEVHGRAYRRTAVLAGTGGVIEVCPLQDEHALRLSVPAAAAGELLQVVRRVRGLFDLDADPLAIEKVLASDPVLDGVLRRARGLRVPGGWDGFELAVRAILGQQVTVRGARTLAGHLVERVGGTLGEVAGPPGLTRLFPTPAVVAAADLTDLGIPSARAAAIRGLAIAVRDGRLDLESAAATEQTVRGLLSLPGVGEWTARYVAMRALRDPDALPASDAGLRRALGRDGRPASPRAVARRAEAWRPWRAYGAMALWGAAVPRHEFTERRDDGVIANRS